jgi:hypothetical protein
VNQKNDVVEKSRLRSNRIGGKMEGTLVERIGLADEAP